MSSFIDSKNQLEIRKEIIKTGNNLLDSKCYNIKSCDALAYYIQHIKQSCNDAFSELHNNNLDEKGNIISNTLCSDLNKKQKEIIDIIVKENNKVDKEKIKGGKTKRKRKRKYVKKNKRRTKKYRKY